MMNTKPLSPLGLKYKIVLPLKMTLLSSLLVACLGLSACQNSSAPEAEKDNADIISAANSDDATADSATTETIAPEVSAEQSMMNNLSRYRWTLVSAADDQEQPIGLLSTVKDKVTLIFNDQGEQTLNYSVGCNIMGASYQLKNDTLLVENSMGTKMLCKDLNAAENLLNELILGNSQLDLIEKDEPLLTQVTSNKSTLTWAGKMTAQAKYNTKGETIFWAVAAESKPCKDNNTQMCLQVKPVTYDEQGLKSSEGEWTEFAGTIDGYEYDGKHDEVLRLQRFKTDKDTVLVDNVDSNYAYVLDTVIESAVAETPAQ